MLLIQQGLSTCDYLHGISSPSRSCTWYIQPIKVLHGHRLAFCSGRIRCNLLFVMQCRQRLGCRCESTMPVVSREKWRRGSLQAPYMNGVCRMSRVNFCFSFISSSSVEESSLHCHLEGWHAAMSGKARKMFLYIIEHINPGGQTKCFIFLWETFKEIPPNKSFRLEGTTFTQKAHCIKLQISLDAPFRLHD